MILYGATSGEVYLHGKAGERFAIRNSGALAVVEGVGDHGCEYMTGGRVVVLGETGVNFAAGMSGGIAYVYDPNRRFDGRCNLDMVDLELVVTAEDEAELKNMILRHLAHTQSPKAQSILDNWESSLPFLCQGIPHGVSTGSRTDEQGRRGDRKGRGATWVVRPQRWNRNGKIPATGRYRNG